MPKHKATIDMDHEKMKLMKRKRVKHKSSISEKGLAYAVTTAMATLVVLATTNAMAEVGEISIPVSENKSAFELAEYYFNADEDPRGPYDLGLARHYYTEAITASSTEHVTAWYQLGRIDFIEGRFDDALRKFALQQQYFGDQVTSVHYMIGLTYGFKARQTDSEADWQKGEEAFQKFITFAPWEPWPRVDLAWIYFAQGQYVEMIPVLEEGLMFQPNNPWLLNMYGLALLNTGQSSEAEIVFENALSQATKVTEEEWGRSYPGNSPTDWSRGLESFQEAIRHNLTLAKESNSQQ